MCRRRGRLKEKHTGRRWPTYLTLQSLEPRQKVFYKPVGVVPRCDHFSQRLLSRLSACCILRQVDKGFANFDDMSY
jgi:hypothetical protein